MQGREEACDDLPVLIEVHLLIHVHAEVGANTRVGVGDTGATGETTEQHRSPHETETERPTPWEQTSIYC